jgi:hypothetical protein
LSGWQCNGPVNPIAYDKIALEFRAPRGESANKRGSFIVVIQPSTVFKKLNPKASLE